MDFYKRVSVVCERIPYGKVATYGQIALLCGKPQHSRQVGYALHKKIKGQNIPAHRVVNATGQLSGAFAFDTPHRQRELLESEGVLLDEKGRIDLSRDGWNHTLQDALDLRYYFEKTTI